MFLYPSAVNHPNKEDAASWLEKQGSGDVQDLSALQLWIDSGFSSFAKYGKIVNIYRERGFIVVQFSTDSEANKFMKNSGGSFNGVDFVHKKVGTPTKADRNALLKEHPMPNLKKKKE